MQQAPKVSQLIGFFNSKSSANVNAPARVLKRPANIHTKQISQGATPNKITAQSTPHLIVKQAPRKTLLSSLTSSSRTSLTSSDSSPKLSVIVAPPPPDLFTLPNELLIHVCSYLTLQELCGLSSTNKALHGTSSTGLLWLQFFKAEFEANTFVFYSDANKYQNAAWRIFYTSMKTLWARMRMFYVRSKRDMFVTDGKGEMTKLQPSSALRETNHTLRFDSKHNCYGYLFHWNIEKKLGNITKWGLDFIEQKSKPSYYVFVWRETVCEKLFEEPVLMLVSPKQSRLLAYSPQEGWYCINTKKMSRTNLPHIPATAEDGVCWIDDRRIAFTSQTEVNTAVFIYNITTKVVEKHIIDDNREIVSHKYMCTCPNTQDLVVMTKDGLMMLNLRTEKWTRLNSGPTSLQGPLSMSPNGTKLAYIAKRDESNLIFVLDTKKNKEFVLGQIKGAKNLLGWHSDNSLFVESSATYVTYSLVFIDTSLELADNEPFYFSNIVNKNTKIKSMQLGTAKMEIDWGDSEPYHISTCDGSMAHQNQFSNQQQNFFSSEHQFEDAMTDSNNYFLSSNDNNNGVVERRGLKRKASFADLGDPAAALSFVNKRMKRLKLPTCDNLFSMQIRVKTLVGRAINLRVEPADTVASLKEKLQAIAGVPHDHQRLIFNGKTLPDDRIVTQVVDLRDGALIHMVLSMSGG